MIEYVEHISTGPMGCSASKANVVPPDNVCETFDTIAKASSLGPRKTHLKLILEEDSDGERTVALDRTITVSLSSADEVPQNVETPRIGRLAKGGRRTSAQIREAPALPLSPRSRLRYVDKIHILLSPLLQLLMTYI